ncbi:hypothetical protein PV729_04265 [Streptomyces europaeiscabiei]|uniref:Uncharacterized protein n=1 Tax=Streptomyces europaeiscabiei TaxID=146819 RepID=A0ABU4N5Z8_9ACTN|nr:hypothetical protein [Streptomyces europaeiscabiei]MDX3550992.1 hypothetical protein [Streptomyces europaeiscabiei]MDX3698448.1 hypothetical protein [Streptomyces europaeiscabiei]
MSYNVFVDETSGRNVTVFSTDSEYDASAIANHCADSGYKVFTDMWSDTIPDAMMSPKIAALVASQLA